MKTRIYNCLLAAALSFGAAACSNELDINPRASLAPETVGPKDVPLLINGVFDGLQTGGTNFFYLSYLTEDLSADNLAYRATFFQHGEVNVNNILSNNVLVARYYTGPYAAIQRANDILGILQSSASAFTPQQKAEYEGATRLLRAYGYYKLVTLFGGVPIVESRSTDFVKRSTEAEVWAFIEKDLDFAAANAPAFTNKNFPSKEAAKALLARVSLINKKWDKARQLAEEVIATKKWSLATNYASIWPAGSTEMIFQINNTITEGAASHGFFLTDPKTGKGGRFELPVDPTLVAAYEPGDVRKDASIAPAPSFPGQFQAMKFVSGGEGADPFYVVRIAEMYLTSAEAQAELTPANLTAALGRLNEVRALRGLSAKSAANVDEFRTAVLHERRVEFAFEGLRWTDLKRTGKASQFLPNVKSANQLLYPIPVSAMDANPSLTQNPGY